jgi:hypothetical protein
VAYWRTSCFFCHMAWRHPSLHAGRTTFSTTVYESMVRTVDSEGAMGFTLTARGALRKCIIGGK